VPIVDTGDLFRRRRSIRRYQPEPVPRETLERILEAGRWAPSGANRQPWLFVVVDDRGAKAEIRRHTEAADAKWHARAPAWMKAFFDHYEITPTKDFLTDVPWLIVVFGERGFPYWRESAWLAIGNMILAATAEGLGSLTYTPGQTSYLNRILGVEDRFVPLAILPIGVPAEAPPPESRPRKPADQVVRFAREWSRWEGTATDEAASHGRDTLLPALSDSRQAIAGFVELASILQSGRSSHELLPRIARILTRLVPAQEIELALRGSALRCEIPSMRATEARPHEVPTDVVVDGGRVTLPLSVNNRVFGAIILERPEPFTPLDVETLLDASRILSLGLWSRFSQPPGR
jgi:nitroreductase